MPTSTWGLTRPTVEEARALICRARALVDALLGDQAIDRGRVHQARACLSGADWELARCRLEGEEVYADPHKTL